MNGLNGRAFDGDPPTADLVQATLAKPLAGRGSALEIAFRYRRGGGTVEAEMTAGDGGARQASGASADLSLTLTAPGAEPLRLSAAGAAPAHAILARERFCALSNGGKLVVEPIGGAPAVGEAAAPETALAFVAMDGAKTLIEQACP